MSSILYGEQGIAQLIGSPAFHLATHELIILRYATLPMYVDSPSHVVLAFLPMCVGALLSLSP